ncbi:MAG TPA: hypothetical protein VFI66_05930, partial [Gemmatimonadales bacterium]|nr:hypothetical protein [Gemmatimonadales bacterium]
MSTPFRVIAAAAALLCPCPGAPLSAQASARDLAGLWEAKLRFGPDIRGPLTLERVGGLWHAEIAGVSADTRAAGDTIRFELPGG